MKKLLALSLLLLCDVAQAQNSSVCRVRIGDEWVPMGASELQTCLKYTEAAATPGEAQYAEFGDLSFSYQDGRYSQSTDGGKTWRKFYPRAPGGEISSLNVLREGPAEPAKSEKSSKKTAEKEGKTPITPATEAASAAKPQEKPEKKSNKKIAASEAATSGYSNPGSNVTVEAALPEVVTPAPEPAALAPPAAEQQPKQRVRRSNPVTASASNNAPGSTSSRGSSGPHDCQLKVGTSWQNVVTPSLDACGKLLVKRSDSSNQTGGQAYWDGLYLLYHRNVLYQSADGRNWHPL